MIEGSRRKFGPALTALEHLHDLDSIGKNEFTMAIILCACQAEVAALLLQNDGRKAAELLDSSGDRAKGLKQLFGMMRATRIAELPRIAEMVDRWEVKVESLLNKEVSPKTAREALLEIGGEVRY